MRPNSVLRMTSVFFRSSFVGSFSPGFAIDHLFREVGEQFRAPVLLRQMVRAGKLGKKSGEGFYRWTAEGPIALPR